VSTTWRTYSQKRPEAEASRTIRRFNIECEHLGETWLVRVMDDSGAELGAGVADDSGDAGLLCGISIAEALET
jgi:hypothetical protein